MAKKNNNKNDKGPAGNTASKNNAIAAPTIKQQAAPASVRDQIKSAGSNGNISKNELLKISDSTGKSTDQIIRQLDKVNANSADKNKAPIGLGNAAANSLIDTRTNGTMFGKSMDQLGIGTGKYANYGTGAIGQAILQAKGSYNYDTNSFSQGTGRIPQGQQIFGTYNGSPQLQIKPQNNVNAGYYGAGAGTGGSGVGTGGGAGVTGGDAGAGAGGEEILPTTLPPEEEPFKPIFQSANGDNLSGNATGFRTPKSSWKKSGKNMAGTNSLKIKPTGLASGVGLSVSGRM
jgi:hypothetical protein